VDDINGKSYQYRVLYTAVPTRDKILYIPPGRLLQPKAGLCSLVAFLNRPMYNLVIHCSYQCTITRTSAVNWASATKTRERKAVINTIHTPHAKNNHDFFNINSGVRLSPVASVGRPSVMDVMLRSHCIHAALRSQYYPKHKHDYRPLVVEVEQSFRCVCLCVSSDSKYLIKQPLV